MEEGFVRPMDWPALENRSILRRNHVSFPRDSALRKPDGCHLSLSKNILQKFRRRGINSARVSNEKPLWSPVKPAVRTSCAIRRPLRHGRPRHESSFAQRAPPGFDLPDKYSATRQVSPEGCSSVRISLWRRANAQNVSFFTLYGGQFTFSTQL